MDSTKASISKQLHQKNTYNKTSNLEIEQHLKSYILEHGSLVLLGMMGAGKTTIGRAIAFDLELPFLDTDQEIENASQMSISEIFSLYGEQRFRELEQQVISRILMTERGIIALGGGAFINQELRNTISEHCSASIWLKVNIELLVQRTHLTNHRPLLANNADPKTILQRLAKERYPFYSQANIIVEKPIQKNQIASQIYQPVLDYLSTHYNKIQP